MRIVGAVLGPAGAVAAFGLARNLAWGRPAVVAVGAVNVLLAGVAMVMDEEGFVIGFVVGGMGVLLGLLAGRRSEREVAAAH